MEPPLYSYKAFTEEEKKQLINLTFLPLMQNFPTKIGQFKGKIIILADSSFFFHFA